MSRDPMIRSWNASPNGSPKQIAVLRALPGLGDFLCITPALRSLRAAFPKAWISYIGLAGTRDLISRYPHLIDEFIDFPGYPGLPEQPPRLTHLSRFLGQMQTHRFDWLLQMHGSGLLTNPVAIALGARRTAGYFLPGHFCPDRDSFLPYSETESEIRRYLRLLNFMGVMVQDETLEFPLQEQDWQDWHLLLTNCDLQQQRYICLHPGASVAARRWAMERFAAVGKAFVESGWQIVLTGSKAELELTTAIAQLIQAPCINLTGCTSLGSLAVLLRQARLLICNDTGVSHLAAALRVPSVVIFSDSDPQRWAPLDRDRHRALVHPQGVSVTAVLEAVNQLLALTPATALAQCPCPHPPWGQVYG